MDKKISILRTNEIISAVFKNNSEECKLKIDTPELTFTFPPFGIVKKFSYIEHLLSIISQIIGGKLTNYGQSIKFKVSNSEHKYVEIVYNSDTKLLLLCDVDNRYALAYVNINKLEQFKQLRDMLNIEMLKTDSPVDEKIVENITKITSKYFNNDFKVTSQYNDLGFIDISIVISKFLTIELKNIKPLTESINNSLYINLLQDVLKYYDILYSNDYQCYSNTVINLQ